ncbi:MAG: substrate-binding domain-containing protein [Chloroflexi bacterium]|nr:substrate-binding domain-containing protein [Chloroflexota bacterium]
MLRNVLLALAVLALLSCSRQAAPTSTQLSPAATPPANPELVLATTTSTQDSGLLDVLIPMFEKQTGYRVKPIAVGSGQAMAMGERGEADVLLAHAPDSEVKFMAGGHGVDRKLVMHNDFVLVGPGGDPAGIAGLTVAKEAFTKIAGSKSLFVSRGDNSGTDQWEKKLWREAGITAKGQPWYLETGQGMGLTLNVASEKAAYTMTDRGTYLAMRQHLHLDILTEGDKSLLNVYHIIVVNPNKSDRINHAGAQALSAFMVSPGAQQVIGEFGIAKFGQPLFFPDAGKPE